MLSVTSSTPENDREPNRPSAMKYLVGGRLTLADIRLFPTLCRMDEV